MSSLSCTHCGRVDPPGGTKPKVLFGRRDGKWECRNTRACWATTNAAQTDNPITTKWTEIPPEPEVRPKSRHILHVTYDYGRAQLSFSCQSDPGAECRLICADLYCLQAGWTDTDENEDGHQHEMKDNGGCVILDWDDLAECGPDEEIALHDGTPVQFRLDGDCWRWAPA